MKPQCKPSDIIDNKGAILFRYISEGELRYIESKGYVWSKSAYERGGTYWTTLFTDNPSCAKHLLRLPKGNNARYRVSSFTVNAFHDRIFSPLSIEDLETQAYINNYMINNYILKPRIRSKKYVSITFPIIYLINAKLTHTSVYDMVKKKLIL